MTRFPRPPVSDTVGTVAFVQRRGAVDYPLEAVPEDFVLWRRKIRREAKGLEMRVSVVRTGDIVLGHNPDHEPSRNDIRATVVATAALSGGPLAPAVELPAAISDAASNNAQRGHLRVVRGRR